MSVINTNITSMIGQQNLNKSQNALQTSMERLSSGLRINSAKDDAAGQAIANRMSSQITGLAQAQRNANDGISVAQTAEGALNQINDNLQRIRELAVQAENGTNSAQDRESIQNEINQRLDEINRISDETNFNDTKVLQSDNNMRIQVGANDGEVITIGLREINQKTLGLEGFNVDGSGEVANDAATRANLVLSDFALDTDFENGGIERFTRLDSNQQATASDVFSALQNGGEVTYTGTANEFGVPADSAYTFDADSNTFSFDASNVERTEVLNSLRPATGETVTADFEIDGSVQSVNIDSQGNLTSADSGAQLYLTADGLLSQNGVDNRPAATLDNVLASMATADAAAAPAISEVQAGSAGANQIDQVTFAGVNNTDELEIDGATLTFNTTLTAAEVANQVEAFVNDGTLGGFTVTGTLSGDYTVTGNDSSGVLTFEGPQSDSPIATTAGVITTQTGAAAQAQIDEVAFEALSAGQSISVGGLTAIVNEDISAADLANEIQAYVNSGYDTATVSFDISFSGTLDADYAITGNDGNGTLTFTGPEAALPITTAGAAGDGTGGSIVVDGTTFSIGAGNAEFGVTNARIGANQFQNIVSGEAIIVTQDGETINIAVDGTVTDSANDPLFLNADNQLVTDEFSEIERFVQENGVVTDGAARQLFVDQDGELTFNAVTEGERTEDALGVLDTALAQVDALRSDLGAIQNRMESAIENLSTTATNLSAARSRIEDADYAVEVANMTRAQILQQAGTSVLAQANQIPQSVLSLLG